MTHRLSKDTNSEIPKRDDLVNMSGTVVLIKMEICFLNTQYL